MKRERERGAAGFESYYERSFGSRWATLRSALLSGRRAARVNRFLVSSQAKLRFVGRAAFLPFEDALPSAAPMVQAGPGLLPYYVMDPASAIPPQLLVSEIGQSQAVRQVLDLCAAPGGKSLILAELLWLYESVPAELTLNERSRARRARLHDVISAYLPGELRSQLRVTGHDAGRWGKHQPSAYDAILLDAPCSSEQHVLSAQRFLEQWSTERIRHLAAQQYAFLTSALLALKPGGVIVYSTCALSDDENDGVIARLLRKKHALATVDRGQALDDGGDLGLEATEYGVRVLPDRHGFGPMYAARIRKR